MVVGDFDLTISAIDGIIRMFQEMDEDMYQGWSEKRWRHFMPVEFAVQSVSKKKIILKVGNRAEPPENKRL